MRDSKSVIIFDKTSVLPCFNQEYVKEFEFAKSPYIVNNSEYLIPRKWQREGYNKLLDQKWRILNAPTGSGKSFVIAMICYAETLNNPKIKVIIVTPQKLTNEQYKDDKANLSCFGFKSKINITPTILNGGTGRRRIKACKNFLETNGKEDRILVCSHATISRTFSEIPAKNRKKLFKNVILWIDEAHHVSSGFLDVNSDLGYKRLNSDQKEEFDTMVGINKLGKLVNFYLNNDFSVGFSTATPFRSDIMRLIPEKYKDSFVRYELPIDEYISKCCKYIRKIGYNFMFYAGCYCNGITKLFSDNPYLKTLIHIPRVGIGESKTCNYSNQEELEKEKHEEVMDVIKAINPKEEMHESYREFNLDGKIVHCPVYEIKISKKVLTIVDMVNPFTRDIVSKYIIREVENKTFGIDVIVALGTFKEGADYPALERSIIIDKRNSINEIMQIFGRILRDFKDKEHPKVYHLLPESTLNNYDNDELKTALNNYLMSVVTSMMLMDILIPKNIKLKTKKAIEKVIGEKFNDEIIIDPEDQNSFNKSVIIESINEVSTDEDDVKSQYEAINDAAKKVMKGMESNEKQREMLRRLKQSMINEQLHVSGFDYNSWSKLNEVEQIDLLKEQKPLGFVKVFMMKALNSTSFQRIRKRLGNINDHDMFEIMDRMMKNNNDKLIVDEKDPSLSEEEVKMLKWYKKIHGKSNSKENCERACKLLGENKNDMGKNIIKKRNIEKINKEIA